MLFDIVVAVDSGLGIGKGLTLPWRLPGDLRHFKRLTMQTSDPSRRNAVIMGRKTWESLPPASRPLPNRLNVVVSRNPRLELPEGVQAASSLDDALAICKERGEIENCFVIGGAQIYDEAMRHQDLRHAYVTEIEHNFDCDVFLSEYRDRFILLEESEPESENDVRYRFKTFKVRKARS